MSYLVSIEALPHHTDRFIWDIPQPFGIDLHRNLALDLHRLTRALNHAGINHLTIKEENSLPKVPELEASIQHSALAIKAVSGPVPLFRTTLEPSQPEESSFLRCQRWTNATIFLHPSITDSISNIRDSSQWAVRYDPVIRSGIFNAGQKFHQQPWSAIQKRNSMYIAIPEIIMLTPIIPNNPHPIISTQIVHLLLHLVGNEAHKIWEQTQLFLPKNPVHLSRPSRYSLLLGSDFGRLPLLWIHTHRPYLIQSLTDLPKD